MKFLMGLFKALQGLAILGIVFYFLGWYIKMHFHPKWFWVFWICSIGGTCGVIYDIRELDRKQEAYYEMQRSDPDWSFWKAQHPHDEHYNPETYDKHDRCGAKECTAKYGNKSSTPTNRSSPSNRSSAYDINVNLPAE